MQYMVKHSVKTKSYTKIHNALESRKHQLIKMLVLATACKVERIMQNTLIFVNHAKLFIAEHIHQ